MLSHLSSTSWMWSWKNCILYFMKLLFDDIHGMNSICTAYFGCGSQTMGISTNKTLFWGMIDLRTRGLVLQWFVLWIYEPTGIAFPQFVYCEDYRVIYAPWIFGLELWGLPSRSDGRWCRDQIVANLAGPGIGTAQHRKGLETGTSISG